MKPIIIQYRIMSTLGVILLVMITVTGIWRYFCGETWYSVLILLAFGIFSGCIFLWIGRKQDIFSEDGIHAGSIEKNCFFHWDQVIQAGIFLNRKNDRPCIAFTFAWGTPRKRGQTHTYWRLRNSKTGLLVPYSQELHQLVLRRYGPLDFDEWNNPEERSTVVD